MKIINNIIVLLKLIIAMLFLLTVLTGKSYFFIPLLCCFVAIGIFSGKDKNKDKDDT